VGAVLQNVRLGRGWDEGGSSVSLLLQHFGKIIGPTEEAVQGNRSSLPPRRTREDTKHCIRVGDEARNGEGRDVKPLREEWIGQGSTFQNRRHGRENRLEQCDWFKERTRKSQGGGGGTQVKPMGFGHSA